MEEETFEIVDDSYSSTDYDRFVNDIWTFKLSEEFDEINRVIYRNTGKRLEHPCFAITPDMGRFWGMWHPKERMLRLNVKLFKNFEWGAVQRVLRHEMGHMVVSEIFNFNPVGCCHGEHWKLAMAAVGEENPRRCDSADFLAGLKGTELCPMAEKVRKLMCKANNEALSKEEADLFMGKAQELMMRYELTMKDVMGVEKLWLKRPMGGYYRKWPIWMGVLGVAIGEIYHVKCIRTCMWIPDIGRRYYLEFFGEPDKLDIAEYVFHAVLNNGKQLYKVALAEHRAKMKSDLHYRDSLVEEVYDKEMDEYKVKTSRFSEASFMSGLIRGWRVKLQDQQWRMKNESATYAIVAAANEKLLDEMHAKVYSKLKKAGKYRSNGQGWYDGHKAGQELNIAIGVSEGEKQLCLNSSNG